MTSDNFIYGKNPLTNVVSVEIDDNIAICYREVNGEIKTEILENDYWILYPKPYTANCIRLHGSLYYCFAEKFTTRSERQAGITRARSKRWDFYAINDATEMCLVKTGITYFKGCDVQDISVLSFDIETTGIVHNKDSKVLLISNTFKKQGKTVRKLFSYDEHSSQQEMIYEWCKWVREMDPSILVGHNIFGFDLPYLEYCSGQGLELGRDGSNAKFNSYSSKFRKDGSQEYDYNNVRVHGREIVDTFFLSIKYDIARNYPSYGLKAIIKYEGLERTDRQHYDAKLIKDNYKDKTEWSKIKAYAEHDADDAMALYDLMIPSFFYYTQSIPKGFQQIINSASGSQVNSFMVRSYIQEKHSIPAPSDVFHYEGGISYGNPGVYSDVYKVDVASLYPSIIRQYEVYDKMKDPKANFLKMVSTFTDERLKNKQLAKETGNRRYKDLEQAQKIMINSAYGFMGAPGLSFNSPKCAALVTKHGREILSEGVKWAQSKGYEIVNVDTDSFSYTRPRASQSFEDDIFELNAGYPEMIRWENDGYYDKFIVVKAKNYVLKSGDKVKIKGSGLKATMKEPALQQFIDDVINSILDNDYKNIKDLYQATALEIMDIKDIKRWSSKKTITKSVLMPQRTNESRVLDAIGKKPVQEGDKIHVFFETSTSLCLAENFKGIYDQVTLLKKLYSTIKIFETILDIKEYPNYGLKKNRKELDSIRDNGNRTNIFKSMERDNSSSDCRNVV